MKLGIEAAALLLLTRSLGPAAAAHLGDTPEKGDRLGSAMVCGDFDSDGIADLAVGAPGESVTTSNVCDANGAAADNDSGVVDMACYERRQMSE